MKNIILVLILTVVTAIKVHAQVLHPGDSTTHHAYVNVLYTDSSTYRYNMPLRMTMDVTDYQDNKLGAAVRIQMYYPNGKAYADAVGVQFRGAAYDNWDASDDGAVYRIVATESAKQSLIIVFQP